MEKRLPFKYDRVSDILYIDETEPYAAQESEEVGDEVAVRLNPNTGEVENVEVLLFSKRIEKGDSLEIPVIAEMHLAAGA